MPSTFQLSVWKPAIPVTVADGYKIDEKQLLAFSAFKNWLESLKKNLAAQQRPSQTYGQDPWHLTGIKIRDVTIFANGKIGFMTIEALMKRGGHSLDRVIFLRGGSVAVLMILRPTDSREERHVVLTEQPRLGAGSTAFLEIPAGMLDDHSGDIIGKAVQAIEEETGLRVRGEELVDMTALALQQAQTKEQLQSAMYMSPANLDEYIPVLLWEKDMSRTHIEKLKSNLSGQRPRDDLITVRIRSYEMLWREGARDAKTLAAWALYEGLSREGTLEDRSGRIRAGRGWR